MFCPLCKAEYRDGFTQCSDCHLPLVATKQEADQQTVTPVWKGGSKSEFESVLTALQDSLIPLLFKEHLSVRAAAQASLLNFFLPLRQRPVYDTEFEVKVLANDATRARQAIQDALSETADEDE